MKKPCDDCTTNIDQAIQCDEVTCYQTCEEFKKWRGDKMPIAEQTKPAISDGDVVEKVAERIYKFTNFSKEGRSNLPWERTSYQDIYRDLAKSIIPIIRAGVFKEVEDRLAPHYILETGSDNATMTGDWFLANEAWQTLNIESKEG
uniref:Uncharacterized protein n=1 Tax=viral metagenome TaxID=1070528 RepID=A0A6M3L2T2_9ZZZZ